jgi:hypothetical protein
MSDTPHPQSVWLSLSEDDRIEYFRLRSTFQQSPKISSKDRRVVAFPREVQTVLRYIERSQENMEGRCIITGLCFVGAIVCINTRQLKTLLHRCKSSINGSFQQLGYIAFRTKAKARSCAVAALPSLECDQNLLRQWTCRVVSESARVCFVSTFRTVSFPEITEADLLDEVRPKPIARIPPVQPLPEKGLLFEPKLLDDDLPDIGDFGLSDATAAGTMMSFSFSVNFFKGLDELSIDSALDDLDLWKNQTKMAKSKSADLSLSGDWDPFVDGLNDSLR